MFFHFLVPIDKLRTSDVGSWKNSGKCTLERAVGGTQIPSSLPTVDSTAGGIVHTHSVKSLFDLHRTKGIGDLPKRQACPFILLMPLKVMQM